MTRRGFTLIEVMISVVILSFVIAGVSAVLIRQGQSSAVQSAQRDLEENGRLALLQFAQAVRMAGYGIDPPAAFDFGRYACTTPDAPATCNGGGRDRIDAPDELVVAWRDPTFARTVTALVGGGPYTLTLNRALTGTIKAGRIVQLVCTYGDTTSYLAVGTDANAGDTTLAVRLLTAADGYFPSTALADACFTSAALVLVERTRFYVANDIDGTPALFRERGRGAAELLYRGIEDVQITYDIGQPPPPSVYAADGGSPAAAPGCMNADAGTAVWSFGACPGVLGAPSHTATPDGGIYPDWRNASYDSPTRYLGHPMNIRNVTIQVVARSISRSPDGSGDELPVLGNRPARARDNYHRAVLSVSEQPINLLTRQSFQPIPSNLGGG